MDEAIELYLADQCSLGRAAELAGVTRWDIQDTLSQRGIPIEIDSCQSVEEMDALTERLERKGLFLPLCSAKNLKGKVSDTNRNITITGTII